MSIAQFADHQMTDAEYRQRRDTIRATYGDTATERTGSFDQELARLFAQSGWTQEQLAKIEGKGQSWVAYRLRFGRFLGFTTGVVITKNLTEGRFRSYWDRTDADSNERRRFTDVAKLMKEETVLSKPHANKKAIGKAIRATIGGGEWHRLTTITTKTQAIVADATQDDVEAVLKGMVAHGWYNVFCEKKRGAQVYRIVLGGHQKIDVMTLIQELAPIIKDLKAEGKKNMATMSPGTVAHLTFQLEKVLDKLARTTPHEGAEKD